MARILFVGIVSCALLAPLPAQADFINSVLDGYSKGYEIRRQREIHELEMRREQEENEYRRQEHELKLQRSQDELEAVRAKRQADEREAADKRRVEMDRQEQELWEREQALFFREHPEYGKDEFLFDALNGVVQRLNSKPENAHKSGSWILIQAHKEVQDRLAKKQK